MNWTVFVAWAVGGIAWDYFTSEPIDWRFLFGGFTLAVSLQLISWF